MITELWSAEGELLWVAVNAVIFNRPQVQWLLDHLPMIREGKWPSRPGVGYIDNPAQVQHSISSRAPFELPCQVCAELETRLTALGVSVELYLIEEHYGRGTSLEEMAKRSGTVKEEIEHKINRAINYIASGPCPRYLDCKDCAFSDGRCKKFEALKRKGKKRQSWSWRDWTQGNLRKHRTEMGVK